MIFDLYTDTYYSTEKYLSELIPMIATLSTNDFSKKYDEPSAKKLSEAFNKYLKE